MQFGFVFPGAVHPDPKTPNTRLESPLVAVDIGAECERAGWDGFFLFEGIWGVDPWVTLAAVAAQTQRIRLGTMLTPPSRRRPWKLASEVATLDQIANGRAILSVGMGATDTGFAAYGEETDLKARAERVDESLAIIDGLWQQGQPFAYDGKHYHLEPFEFLSPPPPVQRPRVPIWVVGVWPRPRSIDRAAQWDGVIAASKPKGSDHAVLTPDDVAALRQDLIRRDPERGATIDIICEGSMSTQSDAEAVAHLRALRDAGATWWIESLWSARSVDQLRLAARRGPPLL